MSVPQLRETVLLNIRKAFPEEKAAQTYDDLPG